MTFYVPVWVHIFNQNESIACCILLYTFGQRRTFDNNNNYATKTQHYFFKLDTRVVFECIVQTQS